MASSMKRAGAVAILCISMGCGSDETDEGTEQDVVTQAGDVTQETADEVSEEMTPVLACSDNVPVVPPAEIIDAYEMCSEADLLLDPCGNKINSLILGKSGHPGEGLDIDENPDTCAPVEDCSAGIDNQLSSLAAVAQPGLDEAIIQGTLNLVLEYEELLDGDDNLVIKKYAGVIAESNEE